MRNHSVCKGPKPEPRVGCGEQLAELGRQGASAWAVLGSQHVWLHRKEDGPRERETCALPFGMQLPKEFDDCGTADVAQLAPCNQCLVLLQWIFMSVFYSCSFLYFVLLVWPLCLAEVLLFIPLGFSGREGLCWPGLGAEWPGCVQVSPPLSASACLSLLLCATSLIYPLLFSKYGHALVEAAAGEELWLSCAQTRTWTKKT